MIQTRILLKTLFFFCVYCIFMYYNSDVYYAVEPSESQEAIRIASEESIRMDIAYSSRAQYSRRSHIDIKIFQLHSEIYDQNTNVDEVDIKKLTKKHDININNTLDGYLFDHKPLGFFSSLWVNLENFFTGSKNFFSRYTSFFRYRPIITVHEINTEKFLESFTTFKGHLKVIGSGTERYTTARGTHWMTIYDKYMNSRTERVFALAEEAQIEIHLKECVAKQKHPGTAQEIRETELRYINQAKELGRYPITYSQDLKGALIGKELYHSHQREITRVTKDFGYLASMYTFTLENDARLSVYRNYFSTVAEIYQLTDRSSGFHSLLAKVDQYKSNIDFDVNLRYRDVEFDFNSIGVEFFKDITSCYGVNTLHGIYQTNYEVLQRVAWNHEKLWNADLTNISSDRPFEKYFKRVFKIVTENAAEFSDRNLYLDSTKLVEHFMKLIDYSKGTKNGIHTVDPIVYEYMRIFFYRSK